MVPLQAVIRSLSVLAFDDLRLMSYQIPGRSTRPEETSLRKQVSSPRCSSVAPRVEVTIVSPTSKRNEPGQLSFLGAVYVGAGEIVGTVSVGKKVGASVGGKVVGLAEGLPGVTVGPAVVGEPVVGLVVVGISVVGEPEGLPAVTVGPAVLETVGAGLSNVTVGKFVALAVGELVIMTEVGV